MTIYRYLKQRVAMHFPCHLQSCFSLPGSGDRLVHGQTMCYYKFNILIQPYQSLHGLLLSMSNLPTSPAAVHHPSED
jgi:hypothetical protein